LTRSKPEITREMAVTASQVYTYSSDKLCRAVNFRFRPLEETIRETCRYYLKDLEASRLDPAS